MAIENPNPTDNDTPCQKPKTLKKYIKLVMYVHVYIYIDDTYMD